MKILAVGLAAVAAVMLWRYAQTPGVPAATYYQPPPPKPEAKHWYDTALGFLGTVAGTALGSYTALAGKGTKTPVKSGATPGAWTQQYTANHEAMQRGVY